MRICVLGLGNLLWADEGFGVRLAERLFPLYHGLEEVAVIDGGTQGLALLPYVQQAQQLLILDAVDFGLAPGTLAVFRDEDVPAYLTAKKLSLHQTGFAEVLALARLLDAAPEQIVLLGVQPVCLEDYGGSLSAPVKAQLAVACQRAMEILRRWGALPHPHALARDARPNHSSLNMAAYESQRPDSAAACRYGDERVLARRSG